MQAWWSGLATADAQKRGGCLYSWHRLRRDSYRGSGRSGVLQRFRAFARRANARAVSHRLVLHVSPLTKVSPFVSVGEAGGRHARRKGAPYRQAGDVACWRCGTTANSEKGAGLITPLPRITSYVRSQLSWSALKTKNLVSTAISVYTFDERRQNRNLAGATVNAPGAELADSSRSHERLVGNLIQQKCNKIYALTSA